MKILRFFATLFILVFCMTFAIYAEEAVVYIDGTNYASLAAAADALPEGGGTIVVTGAVEHSNDSAVAMPSKPVTITSVYGGVDYAKTSGAYFGVGRTLQLSADTVFENITIKQTNSTNTYGNIYANGHHLTLGEGITTVSNETSGRMADVYGGSSAGAFTTECTHITVKSGAWDNIYGGSYQTLNGNSEINIEGGTIGSVYGGSRTWHTRGNSTVTMTGGTVLYTIAGGNALNTNKTEFKGNSNVNISGGTVLFADSGYGVVGGSIGGGNGSTFVGNITLNVLGNAEIYALVLGGSRNNTIATTGDIAVDISGNAKLYRHVYGAGFGANVTTVDKGVTVTVRESVTFTAPSNIATHLCGGANSGTVTGNVTVNVKDNVYVPGHVYGAGYFGSVTGVSTVNISGGTVTKKVSAGAVQTGTIGSGVIALSGGNLGEVLEKASVDLSSGNTLTLGSGITSSSLVGGGKLVIPASATVSADSFDGEIEFALTGTPVANQAYITVADTASTGTVAYTAVENEVMERTVNEENVTFTLKYPDRFDTTNVKIKFYNPNGEEERQPDLVLYSSSYVNDNRVKLLTVTEGNEAEIDLAPGLYYYKVYYDGGKDYHVKHFYISGKVASLSFDVPLVPYTENTFAEPRTIHTTDEVLENFFSTDSLVGYEAPDTPTFTNHTDDDRTFMSNSEVIEYSEALADKCDYLYLFIEDLEDEENHMPVLVYTKDTVAEGGTLEDIAATVRSGGIREILMISGGVHGNEPAGEEGVLNFASSLTEEYGSDLLDFFGAIVVIPASSPDNLMRFTREHPDGVNPNRDFPSLIHSNTQTMSYIIQQFAPTVYIDCHEDNSGTIGFDTDNAHANMDDVAFAISGVANTPTADINGLINGTSKSINERTLGMITDMIDRANATGVRAGHYQWPYYSNGQSHSYASVKGAYGFLVEVMRIWSGKSHYERAVFAMETGIKAVVAEIVERDGAIANEVAAARVAAAVDTFDSENYFATKMALGGTDFRLSSAHPSVYPDGTYKDENAVSSYKRYDKVTAYRPMATGYVLDAEASNIGGVLEKLEQHAIEYTYIKPSSALELKKYTISNSVTYSEGETVVFENGAYAVHTNTSDSYLISYLFEPDSYVSEDTKASLYQMGLISDTDALYRSETDGFKAIIEALVYVENDFDGDGKFDIADAFALLKAIINDEAIANSDVNGDGVFNLVDVIRVLKAIVM